MGLMNVITISREYGAGGYEVASNLARALGWELLDRELLHQAALVEHLPDAELERLDEKAVSLTDRFRLHPPHAKYIHGLRQAARQAVARGNVILVGRGTGQLIDDTPNVLHVRLVATQDWRARRMARREGWTLDQALARCTEEDRNRERFMRYFFGDAPFQAGRFALVFNTGRVPVEDVVAVIMDLVRGKTAADPAGASRVQRTLTLSRELAAGDTSFVPTLGDRLGLRVYDRGLLEQEAARLGVSEGELERVDEQPAGIFQRFHPGSLFQRYFEVLGQLMKELASRGNVLLVGRGGSGFLRNSPGAFHVRLVASTDARIRRVMEDRWMREGAARQLISQSDAQRNGFYRNSFGADWSSPLEYHLTVNSARLGPAAIDVVVAAAERHWLRVPQP
jgi:cytidylate kinase